MLVHRQYFSVREAAEYLSEKLGEQVTIRDIILLGEIGTLPFGAFRSDVDELVYFPGHFLSSFDPVKSDIPDLPLILGYDNPEDALKGGPVTFTEAPGYQSVTSIEKLVIPGEYLTNYITAQQRNLQNPRIEDHYVKPETQQTWSTIRDIYRSVRREFPDQSKKWVAQKTATRAENDHGITINPDTIRKDIAKLL